MNDDIADDATTTRQLDSYNDSVFSFIDHSGDQDWFAVTLNKAYTYQVWLQGESLYDPYLSLYGPGVALADDDGFGGLDSFLDFKPTTTGTYYLAAEAYSDDTGSYTLTVERDTPADASSTVYVVVDAPSPFRERVGFGVDLADWVIVDLTAGVTYQFDLIAEEENGIPALADPYLTLQNRAGTSIIVADDDSGEGLNSRIIYTPTTSGTYTLNVEAYSQDQIGSYALVAGRLGGSIRNGSGGNDAFMDQNLSETFEGGSGTDAVTYVGRAWDYGVERTASGFTVRPLYGTAGNDLLNNMENVLFDDRGPYVHGSGGAAAIDAAGGTINGGGGLDTLYLRGTHTQYTVNYTASGFTVTGNGVNERVVNVERLAFSDGFVGLDVHGNAGMGYRVYQAAFNRQPDTGGLGFWINAMDGGMSVTEVAANFAASLEFRNTYGSLNDNQFAAQLYRNVLHRESDAGGLSFWTDSLGSGRLSRAEVLAAFSESNENKANLIGVIEDGMFYQITG